MRAPPGDFYMKALKSNSVLESVSVFLAGPPEDWNYLQDDILSTAERVFSKLGLKGFLNCVSCLNTP